MSCKRKRRSRANKIVRNKNGQSKTSRYLEDKLTIIKMVFQLLKIACDTYYTIEKLWESLKDSFF